MLHGRYSPYVRVVFISLTVQVLLRKEEVTPWEGWDGREVQPSLREVIESDRVEWPRDGRALVPGCGRVWMFHSLPMIRMIS
jgi:hypothetical protein